MHHYVATTAIELVPEGIPSSISMVDPRDIGQERDAVQSEDGEHVFERELCYPSSLVCSRAYAIRKMPACPETCAIY